MRVPRLMRVATRLTALALVTGATLLVSQPAVHTQAADPLPFSKGFLVTGDYAVGSVDLLPSSGGGGFLTGTIPMSGVPANADVIAAFLYWETIHTQIAQVDFPKFRDQPITVAKATSSPLTPSTAPCWSGGSSNNTYTMTNYRADVLRLLPVETDSNGKPTGRVLVNSSDLGANGPHTVTLPDNGTGNQVPATAGATLFVVYRTPTDPLRHISLYDGLHIQAPGMASNHTIAGVLQMAPGATAKMTKIVSSGANNANERLLFNGTVIASDPFLGGSNGSERGWASPTYDVTPLMGAKTDSATYGEQVTTSIDHTSTSPYECISMSAIIFSTAVLDADQDGLPDRLESQGQSGLTSPDDRPLPDLYGMGARAWRKDLFIEVGAMKTELPTSYGGGDPLPAHNHLPRPKVLAMVGEAYRKAPVANISGPSGIFVHFDVGDNYHALGGEYADTVVDLGTDEVPDLVDVDQYLVPAYLARGGESIAEADCAATVPGCAFPGYPGTVSWKIGYQLYRDAPVGLLGQELSATEMDACDAEGDCVRRRFDQNRMNFFRYGLFAHYRGKPKELCQTGTPAEQQTCRDTNPNFRIPSTASGVADLPGGDFMVTTGAWGNGGVGSDFVNASTMMHELGHTLWRTHGGHAATVSEPNCKPNYLSIMNYLFQLGGLRDEDGKAHLDYSRSSDGTINENTLFNDPSNPPVELKYRTAWYAPLLPGTLPFTLGTPAATRFCNGALFPETPPAPHARVDFYSSTLGAIDWSGGLLAGPPQDVNFDGQLSATLAGAEDWNSLRLNQVGSRRNMAGFSNGIEFEFGIDFTGGLDFTGGMDFEFGIDFTGGVDYSWGIDFTGGVDFEFGIDFTGGVDLEYGIDFTGGIESAGGAEMDLILAAALGNTPANEFKACVIGNGSCAQGADPLHRVRLTWKAPDVGTVASYVVLRVAGHTVTPASEIVEIVPANGLPIPGTQLSLVDGEELPDNQPFTYYIRAVFEDGSMSVSNFSKIIADNDAPLAVLDADFTTPAGQALNGTGLLANDTDTDSATTTFRAVLDDGPDHASAFTLNPDGSFSYTPAFGFAGTDTFTYRANNGTYLIPPTVPMSPDSNAITVTIIVVDSTPPLVTVSIPAATGLAGWNVTSPVIVTVTATDVSGVNAIACSGGILGIPSGLGTASAQALLSVSGNGTHAVVCNATDGVGNGPGVAPGSVNTGTVKIDTVAPTVNITTPALNGVYILNAAVNAGYTCSDPAPPVQSGVASCIGNVATGAAINTSTVGPKTFTVTGKDVAGNETTTVRSYLVVYAFTLTPLKSTANLGSAVPIDWQLKDAFGVSINSLTTLLKMESVFNGPAQGGCTPSASGTTVTLYDPATGAKGGSDFRLVSGGYRFNWASGTATSTGKGCYTILITLNDGSAPKLTNAVQLK